MCISLAFQRDEQRDSFHGIVTSIHIITHEEIVGVRARSADSENFHEIVKLCVDVTAYYNRRADCLHVGLVFEDFACLTGIGRLHI